MYTVSWHLAPRFRAAVVLHHLAPKNSLGSVEGGGHEALSCSAAKVCGPSGGGVQDLLWQKLFSDPAQWWDYRRSKETSRHPDFRHKESKEALWLNSWNKPAWVESQLAMLVDAGISRPPGFVSTMVRGCSGKLAQHEGDLEVGTCRKLCEVGQVTEAVDALRILVQRGYRLDNRLFYRVLKRCMVQKDLVLGRRIHALAVKNGHEGNSFLANHLIRLYASHGKLEEAMQVFSKVTTPDAYMWASIILAYAKHGEPTQALVLYQQMRESTGKPDNHVFVAVLKACASAGDLASGKDVHSHILARADLKLDMFIQNSLVHMYAKCHSLEDAQRVFDSVSHKDVVTWNAMITGYVQQGLGQEALHLYSDMQQEGLVNPNAVTFVCLLQACASIGVAALQKGRHLHAEIKELGLHSNVVVGNNLVNMYTKCGSLEDAQKLFKSLARKDVVTWTAMIAGYAQQGLGHEALGLFSSMQQEGVTPCDSVAFVCLLQACASVGAPALQQGKQLHAQIEKLGLHPDVVVGASLVNMYAKCMSLKDAQRVFDNLSQKNVVTWTALIAGYAQQGKGQEALNLYRIMLEEGITPPNSVTFVCLLQACALVGAEALTQGKQLHAQIEEQGLQDVVMWNSLVNMYAKCGSLKDAQRVFDKLPSRDVVTWTAMIAGYAQQGMGEEALSLYSRMEQEGSTSPNSVTFVCLLQACASVGVAALQQGRQLHTQIEQQGLRADVVVGNSLVDMYAKCGSIEDAQSVFDGLSQKDVVTWTAMITGYCQQGMGQEALGLFSKMQQEGITAPNYVTFVCLLQACASTGVASLLQGKQLHAQIEQLEMQADEAVGASLVNMYAKCGSIEDAQRVFDTLQQKTVVTWTTLISGYVQQGMVQEALSLYSSMQQEGSTAPDSVTFVCLLQACASVAALPLGKQLHVEIEGRGLQADVEVGPSLVNMYAKCGCLEGAQQVFDSLPKKEVAAWGALIAGYARQGDSENVFDLIHMMKQEGIQPNGITFLSLLTVCSHVGLVDKGRMYFKAMSTDYAITPTIEHYTCMVDLLGRAGHLDEALQVAKTMHLQPNVAVWLTLLGACQKWNNVEVGRQAFESAVSLEDEAAAAYVLMSNIYSGAQMWEQAKEMQGRRVKFRAWKQPGQSWWIDMEGVVHSFVVGEASGDQGPKMNCPF